jgi:hypothetical protein
MSTAEATAELIDAHDLKIERRHVIHFYFLFTILAANGRHNDESLAADE